MGIFQQKNLNFVEKNLSIRSKNTKGKKDEGENVSSLLFWSVCYRMHTTMAYANNGEVVLLDSWIVGLLGEYFLAKCSKNVKVRKYLTKIT